MHPLEHVLPLSPNTVAMLYWEVGPQAYLFGGLVAVISKVQIDIDSSIFFFAGRWGWQYQLCTFWNFEKNARQLLLWEGQDEGNW